MCENAKQARPDLYPSHVGVALCASCSTKNERITVLEGECLSLAATQCHDGYGDDGGNWRCKYQDRIKELESFIDVFMRELKHVLDGGGTINGNTIMEAKQTALKAMK